MCVYWIIYLLICCSIGINGQHPFRDHPHNATSLLSGSVTLTCSVPDESPADIRWQHSNGTNITSSERLTITYNPSTGESQLTITNLQYYDNGAYQCVAVYSNGTTYASVAGYITTIG